ncbi:MAG: hypothetical protein IJY57_03105 [Clostridia bacterium]|nr:hypothetical protein [Clostridia bacterium]
MAKLLRNMAIIAFIFFILFLTIYLIVPSGIILSLTITFATIFYHFIMRLIVGLIINAKYKNDIDYNKKWFRVSLKEQKFYEKLKVKSWKNKMPTYNKSFFDSKTRSWEEIAKATCQAEIVHEIIIVLSFLPIIASIWLGAIAVFIITSVISALIDSTFVIMQRYNRPRILRLIKK